MVDGGWLTVDGGWWTVDGGWWTVVIVGAFAMVFRRRRGKIQIFCFENQTIGGKELNQNSEPPYLCGYGSFADQ